MVNAAEALNIVQEARLQHRFRACFSAAAQSESQATLGASVQRISRWGDDNRDATHIGELRSALEEDAIHERSFHFLFFRAGPALVLSLMALWA
jgi:hypothetical protein